MAQRIEDDKISEFDDDFSRQLRGTLSFVNDDAAWGDNKQVIVPSQDSSLQAVSSSASNVKLKFEVTEAHVEKIGKSKFVAYSIVIGLVGAADPAPVVLSRRYSNFEQLYKRLCRRFSNLSRQVDFPEKVLLGNFKQNTITDRSRRFEQFLHALSEIDSVRISAEFADFFYGSKLREAHSALSQGSHRQALPILQDLWHVAQKIAGYRRPETLAVLIGLVVTSFMLEQYELSQSYVEIALQLIDGQYGQRYAKPLLHFGIRLYWTLGKDKSDLERRLQLLEGSAIVKDLQTLPAQVLLSLALDDIAHTLIK